MTITRRISGAASSASTRRLEPTVTAVDPWGGAWGDAWGQAWGTPAFTLAISSVTTRRVTEEAGSTVTKRLG